MVDQNPDTNDYPVAQAFPGLDRESALKKVKETKAWLQQLPLFRRPLVKSSAQVGFTSCQCCMICIICMWHHNIAVTVVVAVAVAAAALG